MNLGGSMLEAVLYKNEGWVLNDVNYRHSSGAVPTIVHIGAGEQIDDTAYQVMNDVIFGLAVNYTVPAGKKAIIAQLEINVSAVAIGGDMDSVLDIYADAVSVKTITVPQNVTHYLQGYPICREFAAAEVISFYGKSLAANGDKTFNMEAWILVTSA